MWLFCKRNGRDRQPIRRVPSRFQPRLEVLEDRCVPSASVTWAFGTGSLADDAATAVATDKSGDVYVAGYIGQNNNTGNPPPQANLNPNGTTDVGAGMFVAKYNPDHSLAWAQNVANAQANAISVDSSGNVLVTGSFSGTTSFGSTSLTSTQSGSTYSTDAFVTKLDTNGNFLWADAAGGTGTDGGSGIAVDNSGNAYVTGSYQGSATFGSTTLPPGNNSVTSAFVIKLDPNGNYLWAEHLSNTAVNGDAGVWGNAIAVDSNGNAYITGAYNSTVNFNPKGSYLLTAAKRAGGYSSQDAFVLKLDTNGNFDWAGSMGGNGADSGNGIAVDGSGNVYLTGTYGPEAGGGNNSDSNNNFNPGSGSKLSLPLGGGGDSVFVEKLTTNGKLVWGYGLTSSSTAWYGTGGGGITVDSSGNVYLTGYFSSTLTVNSTSGKTSLTSQGSIDAFVLKLDTNGKFISDMDLGGAGGDFGLGIAWDPATGNVYTVGSYQETAYFGPYTLTTAGGIDLYNSPQKDLFLAELTM